MIPAMRRDRILRHVRQSGAATVAQLADAIGASESTVRRDIDTLAAQGALARMPGGVMAPERRLAAFEPDAAEAERLSTAEKIAIGEAAAAEVAPGQCVVFDTGTTARAAARAVVARGVALTAVTIDLQTALALSESAGVTLIVPGGVLRQGSYSLLGAPGLEFLRGIHADLALMGAHAISGGLVTETSVELAETKAVILRNARRSLLLADATKFRAPAFRTVAPLNAFAALITDARLDAAARAMAQSAGLTVTLATPGGAAAP